MASSPRRSDELIPNSASREAGGGEARQRNRMAVRVGGIVVVVAAIVLIVVLVTGGSNTPNPKTKNPAVATVAIQLR